MLPKLTPHRIYILFKLYTNKIQPGTIVDICRQLDGANIKPDTYTFLRILIINNSLRRFTKTRLDLGIVNGIDSSGMKPNPTYEVNKETINREWQQTIEYQLSRKIIEDESIFGKIV